MVGTRSKFKRIGQAQNRLNFGGIFCFIQTSSFQEIVRSMFQTKSKFLSQIQLELVNVKTEEVDSIYYEFLQLSFLKLG